MPYAPIVCLIQPFGRWQRGPGQEVPHAVPQELPVGQLRQRIVEGPPLALGAQLLETLDVACSLQRPAHRGQQTGLRAGQTGRRNDRRCGHSG